MALFWASQPLLDWHSSIAVSWFSFTIFLWVLLPQHHLPSCCFWMSVYIELEFLLQETPYPSWIEYFPASREGMMQLLEAAILSPSTSWLRVSIYLTNLTILDFHICPKQCNIWLERIKLEHFVFIKIRKNNKYYLKISLSNNYSNTNILTAN